MSEATTLPRPASRGASRYGALNGVPDQPATDAATDSLDEMITINGETMTIRNALASRMNINKMHDVVQNAFMMLPGCAAVAHSMGMLRSTLAATEGVEKLGGLVPDENPLVNLCNAIVHKGLASTIQISIATGIVGELSNMPMVKAADMMNPGLAQTVLEGNASGEQLLALVISGLVAGGAVAAAGVAFKFSSKINAALDERFGKAIDKITEQVHAAPSNIAKQMLNGAEDLVDLAKQLSTDGQVDPGENFAAQMMANMHPEVRAKFEQLGRQNGTVGSNFNQQRDEERAGVAADRGYVQDLMKRLNAGEKVEMDDEDQAMVAAEVARLKKGGQKARVAAGFSASGKIV